MVPVQEAATSAKPVSPAWGIATGDCRASLASWHSTQGAAEKGATEYTIQYS